MKELQRFQKECNQSIVTTENKKTNTKRFFSRYLSQQSEILAEGLKIQQDIQYYESNVNDSSCSSS